MKLFWLKRLGDMGYDHYEGLVVRAESEEQARQIASQFIERGEFNKGEAEYFLDSAATSCSEITQDGAASVILQQDNQNAG